MTKLFVLLIVMALGGETAIAQTCSVPPPSRYDGTTKGIALPGGARQFNFEYAQIAGFDCFEADGSWWPSYINSLESISPQHTVVDMAYTNVGTATFFDVVAPVKDNYTLSIRYAFGSGAYPQFTDRPEGIRVNGVVITYNMHFPITYSFENYDYSRMLIPLDSGRNVIQIFNVTDHGVARLDTMTLTPPGSSPCSGPATVPIGLSATTKSGRLIRLKWTASTWPTDCAIRYYKVFRSNTSGFIPSSINQIASRVTTTSYVDVRPCDATDYYVVMAVDSSGASASSEVSATTKCNCFTRDDESPDESCRGDVPAGELDGRIDH